MNKVFINEKDKIGEIILVGDQTKESANQSIKESIELDAKQQDMFDRVATLVDITQIGNISAESQKATINGLVGVNFDKLAVLGASSAQRIILQTVIQLSGKKEKVKFFDSRKEALTWLNIVSLV